MSRKYKPNTQCKQLLHGKTVSRGKRDVDVAKALGMTPESYSRRINKPSNRFYDDEIAKIVEYLDLSPYEMLEIFFPNMLKDLQNDVLFQNRSRRQF